MSLRRRLLIILFFTLSGVWLFSATANYFDSRHEIEELMDDELKHSADVLMALSDRELTKEKISGSPTSISVNGDIYPGDPPYAHKHAKNLVFQIWLGNSTLALRSASAPNAPLSALTSGYSDQMIANQLWRIYSIKHPDSPILVQVGERYDVRSNLINSITMRILTPVLIALPIVALTIWYGIAYAMRPLSRLANEVAARKPDYLDPVDSRLAPNEAQPLVHSLNALLTRLQTAFDRERNFTADAAHELRTPLASIKIQAQVAQMTHNREDQQRVLQKVIDGVDNATRIVQQLLILARIDPATPLKDFKEIDVCHSAAAVIRELVPLALRKNIDISLSETCQGIIMGNADTLSMLLGNLIHNAINYTPENGAVTVDVVTHPSNVVLTVMDSGPGIPAEEREKVLRRFYRGRNVTQSGSGLGLSIVSRIAELHSARIVLGVSKLGGLQVDVIFPQLS